MFGFLHFSLIDLLDILLVAVIFFYVFRLIRGSQAMSIFIAIVAIYAIGIVAEALNMKLMSSLMGTILDVGMIALIVIFQPEIRRFLSSLGRKAGGQAAFWKRFSDRSGDSHAESINEICKACEEMSADKCGALMVIKKKDSLQYIAETGDAIDARISKRLLMNLFFKNSPLHDGAVILDGDRVVAARCTLPISQQDLPASFGMRHKAAVGISEETDSLVIVVSEETGGISVMQGGKTTHVTSRNALKTILMQQ